MKFSSHKITIKYVLIAVAAVLLTFIFHELAHYIVGEILGYDMKITLNSVSIKNGENYKAEWHQQIVSAAGPIFTLIQAFIMFIIIKRKNNVLIYPFLFTAALMRIMAAVISYIGEANDEARISEWAGIGKMTLPILVSSVLIFWTYKASKKMKLSWKLNLTSFVIISASITALIYTNEYFIK